MLKEMNKLSQWFKAIAIMIGHAKESDVDYIRKLYLPDGITITIERIQNGHERE